jgi:ribonuclease R
MRDRVGERFEGTVTAVVGSGLFVQLDTPFVDVLVRLEDLGPDNWAVDDDALRVFAARSGERIGLGDRLLVEITDAAILRRTVYARRVGGEGADGQGRVGKRPPLPRRGDKRRPEARRDGKPQHRKKFEAKPKRVAPAHKGGPKRAQKPKQKGKVGRRKTGR